MSEKDTNALNDEILAHKLQKAQLDILKELDRVCRELKLDYELAFGSSLGAKRHKGFIPWDDDIDVYMRIEELEVLQKQRSLFQKPYFLQYTGSDPEYRMMITRLRNSETTLIEKEEVDRDINHGVFIDIYPLFNSPKSGFGAKWLICVSMLYCLMLYSRVPKHRGLIMKVGSIVLLNLIPRNIRKSIIKHCYNIMRNSPKTGYLSSLFGDEIDVRYSEECFFPAQWVLFNGENVPVQADHDQYLRLTFGDYMTLPPIEQRKFHHDFVYIDFEKSYSAYKGIYYCR